MNSAIGGVSMGTGGMRGASMNGARPDPAKMTDQIFSKLDTGGKGYIDKADFQSAISQVSGGSSAAGTASGVPSADDMMKSLDSSGDGQITKQEFSEGMKKLTDQFESQFNASRMGSQSGAKPPRPSLDEAFSNMDTDSKGYLDKNDLQNAIDKVSDAQGETSSATNETSSGLNVDDLMSALDTDGDEKITKQEFTDGMKAIGGPPGGQGGQGGPGGMGGPGGPGGMGGMGGMGGPPPGGMKGAGGAEQASETSSSTSSYDAADTNQDGTVTAEELSAYQETSAYASSDSTSETKKQSGANNEQSNRMAQQILQMLQAYTQDSSSFGASQSSAINVAV